MRNKCIVCGAPLYDTPLYKKRGMPALSQNLPLKEELNNDKAIEYRICQCSGCGLVQFDCEPVEYYKDSTRAGERCDVLIELRKSQYEYLIEHYNLRGKKIIEIGAGKGGFLKTLKEMTQYQIKEYGVENNIEFVRIANEIEGVNVFQGDVEEDLCFSDAPFDAFTSFAYPARLINPNKMLQNVYNNTTDDVVGIIQVPSMEHLLKPGGFFDITRDHIAYYDKNTLDFLLRKNGFEIVEFGEVSQIYIYAIVKKRKKYSLEEIWQDVDLISTRVYEFAKKEYEENRRIAVWCAGHYAFTVISLAKIEQFISYIIDNAEFKKGRYSPASHIPIYGPEHYEIEKVDTIMILGPIYIKEIVDEIKQRCLGYIKIVTIINQDIVEVN